ncbi:hypothetical protein ACMFMF_001170 [Clarireedia jacksonii]
MGKDHNNISLLLYKSPRTLMAYGYTCSPPSKHGQAHTYHSLNRSRAIDQMAPNLYLCVRKLFYPMEWIPKCHRHKRSGRKFLYCAEPIPGIYGICKGRRYLVAIRPIPGQEDSEHIFAPIPQNNSHNDRDTSYGSTESAPVRVLRQIIERSNSDISKAFPKCKGISPIDLGGYRYLHYSLPVVYSDVLQRWIFKDELQYRDVIYHDPKNYGSRKMHFFTLDDAESYVFLGYWCNGRTGLSKDHMGINEVLWVYDEKEEMIVKTTPVQETLIRRKMAGRRPEFLSANEEDDFMKVVRYVRRKRPEA